LSWKKRFAPTIPLRELVHYGPLRIDLEPENLGGGKYRVRAIGPDGMEVQFTTFEGTIGNINQAAGEKGFAVAYESEQLNTKGFPYINWKTYEETEEG